MDNSWDDDEVLPRIPQYDVPEKIIQAVDLIDRGIDDSFELGYKLGHRGKKMHIFVVMATMQKQL